MKKQTGREKFTELYYSVLPDAKNRQDAFKKAIAKWDAIYDIYHGFNGFESFIYSLQYHYKKGKKK